jgi:hypothetical protein
MECVIKWLSSQAAALYDTGIQKCIPDAKSASNLWVDETVSEDYDVAVCRYGVRRARNWLALCIEGGNRSKRGEEERELRGGNSSSPLPPFAINHRR